MYLQTVNALKYVREVYKPEKPFLIGLSMGAHSNKACSVPQQRGFWSSTAIPSTKLYRSWKNFEELAQKVGRYYILGLSRLGEEGVESLSRYNVLKLADRITTPILIIYAKDLSSSSINTITSALRKTSTQRQEARILG